MDVTETLLKMNEVLVYKIPPRKFSGGHRASEWGKDGDLSEPMFIGSGKVLARGELAFIQIFRKSPSGDDTLFATCPIKINTVEDAPDANIEFFCEKVVDSSRYFVIRIADDTGTKVAYIGLGFSTRDPAYDFQSVLNDHVRFVKRTRGTWKENTASSSSGGAKATDADAPAGEDSGPKLDLTFKEGQTVKINIKKRGDEKKKKGKTESFSGGFLPPPSDTASGSAGGGDDDWGSFEPAPTASVSNTKAAADDDWGDFQS